MSDNPYSPPEVASHSGRSQPLSPTVSGLGLFASLALLTLYGIIAAMSVYEWLSAPNQSLVTDYVRTLIASILFGGVSLIAAVFFYQEKRQGLPLLFFASLLLSIFIFPGLNVVWNFIETIGP
jgi:hypothetical protein